MVDIKNFVRIKADNYKNIMNNCPKNLPEVFEYNKGKFSGFSTVLEEIERLERIESDRKRICGLCLHSESIPYEEAVYCKMHRVNQEWDKTCEKFEEY